MLRITVQDTPNEVTLKLEGSLVGAWVAEFENAWRAENSKLAGRWVRVDLTAVDRVDPAGKYLLTILHDHGTGEYQSDLRQGNESKIYDVGDGHFYPKV